MADEPDNLILRLLREIRETQVDHGEQSKLLNRRMDEVHETVYTAAGIAAHANTRHDTVTDRLEAIEARLDSLEEKA